MSRVLRLFVIFVLLAFSFANASGQSVYAIENRINFYLSKMKDFGSYSEKQEGGQEDSLAHYDKALKLYMKTMLVRQPLTLKYNFNKINKAMTIASKDGKSRIYSWDSQDGGTMHGFNSIFQFKAGKDIHSCIYYIDTFLNGEWTGPGYFYSNVYTITSKAGKTYYLAIRNGIYSSALSSVGVQCFSIENGGVNDSIKLFKTKAELLNSIDIELDYTVLTIMISTLKFIFQRTQDKCLFHWSLIRK
jgi:hypothetical protein